MEAILEFKGLESELRYFQKHRADLLKTNKGQFALIKGHELIGTFTTFQQAYEEGVARFKSDPFLIKQVLEQDTKEQIPALSLCLLHAHIN